MRSPAAAGRGEAAPAAATATDRRAGVAALALVALALTGCGSSREHAQSPPRELRAYVDRVEPLRLGVNRLLDGADPILEAYREHRVGPRTAQRRFGRLERRFAAYAARVAAIRPIPDDVRAAADAYAHTYVLEDSYLSALTAALPDRAFNELPHTADRQRAAIIAWRIRLEVLARRLGIDLPHDLQVAGRGEIAPSPEGD